MRTQLLIALTALLIGCGSKDDKGAVAGPKTIATSDDYMAFNDVMADKFLAIIKSNPDCDKLGSSLSSLMDDNKAMNDATKVWEKAHPDDKKTFDTKMDAKLGDVKGPMMELFTKCKTNKAFTDAMAKMDAAR